MVSGIIAVLGLITVVAVKYLTTVRIQKMSYKVAEAEKEIRKVRGQMKAAENNKAAAEVERRSEESRGKTLRGRIGKYKAELQSLKRQ